MSIFIKNTNLNGVMDVEEYLVNSNKEKQAFVHEDLTIVKLFRFKSSYTTYIGGETLEGNIIPLKVVENTNKGLTLDVVKLNMKLRKSFIYDYILLGESVLLIPKNDETAALVNLNTKQTILDLPKGCMNNFGVIGNKNSFAIKFYNSNNKCNSNSIAFIKNGELDSIHKDYYGIETHTTKNKQFFTAQKKFNEPVKIVYFNDETECLKEVLDFDNVISPDNTIKDNCIAIRANKLYLLENHTNIEAKLIKVFDSDIHTSLCECRNVILIHSTTNSYLFDFNGNLIDENVLTTYNPAAWLLSNNLDENIIYSKKDGTKWFYDLKTKEKVEICFNLGNTNPIKNYLITHFDFDFTALEEVRDRYNNFNNLSLKKYIRSLLSQSKEQYIKDIFSSNLNILNTKIFIGEKDNKITFYTIEGSELKSLFKEKDEVQFFDAFMVNVSHDYYTITAINSADIERKFTSFSNTKKVIGKIEFKNKSIGPFFDIKKILKNINQCTCFKIDNFGNEVIYSDINALSRTLNNLYNNNFNIILEELDKLYNEYL